MPSVTPCNHSLTVIPQSLPLARPASQPTSHSLTRRLSLIFTRSVIHLSFFTKLFLIAYCLFKRPFRIREAVVPFSARPTVIVPNRGFSR